jgi:hypothetical protein
MVYLHPWEVDPQQPRFAVGAATRLRHYSGLNRTADRLRRLLDDFRFGSVASVLDLAPESPREAAPQVVASGSIARRVDAALTLN